MPSLPTAKDKLLFTPGPLTTSLSVKQAMLHDAGSWHFEFNEIVRGIREELLAVAGVSRAAGWECVLMQGSGTFGVESVITSTVPPEGKLLVLSNGAYGERIGQMAATARLPHHLLRFPEDEPATAAAVDRALTADPAISHVALVHCETTTGILNPLTEAGQVVKRHRRVLVVDAMSSFGGLPLDLETAGVDYLVSSANKCIEGVPGFSFVFARREALLAAEGWARSLSLDLLGQWKAFEKNGQFRFTPPTHALLAFAQALRELADEGGVAARNARYVANHRTLLAGMAALGFRPLLRPTVQSPIITAFHFPNDEAFGFDPFYRRLSDRGMIIYPGKLTQVNTFRIGTIGRLFPADIEQLVHAVTGALDDLGCRVPVAS